MIQAQTLKKYTQQWHTESVAKVGKLWTAISRVSDVVAMRSLRQIVRNRRRNLMEWLFSMYEV